MSIKITIPNSSSDVLTFGSGNTPTAAQIAGIDSGSSNGQLALYTTASGTSTERVRVDASGNVGIGVTPKAWESSYKVLSIGLGGSIFGRTSAGEVTLSGNLYRNTAGTWKYINAGGGTLFIAGGDSTYTWYNVATGGSADGNASLNAAMTLDSSGNLLVGTTSTVGAGVISVAYSAATSIGLGIKQTNSGVGTLVNFYNSAGTSQGYIYNNNNGTVSYANGSDYRLKSDIAALTDGLAQVMQLKPCTYKYIGHEQTVSGFIAHELAEVCPQAVVGEKDAVDADGNPVYQGVDTSFLVATLTAAIQEQQAIITSLTDRVSALDERLTALENK
jgi:hypothetical protein